MLLPAQEINPQPLVRSKGKNAGNESIADFTFKQMEKIVIGTLLLTPNHVTSCGVHLRVIALVGNKALFEEMLQR